jgi:hypothetical protein
MTNENTLTLQDLSADREWWSQDAGAHHRELADWLRGLAAKCRLPYPQQEILKLARTYERRAAHLENRLLPTASRR